MDPSVSFAAGAIATIRRRQLILIDRPTLGPGTVAELCATVSGLSGDVDVVLRSPGGYACCAYRIARELRRRFSSVGMFVPLAAKSAATLLALAGDELIIGDRGELGPLDAQYSDKQHADFPVDRSRLEVGLALTELSRLVTELFDERTQAVVARGGMRLEDACRVATDLAIRFAEPMLSKISPQELAHSQRALEMTEAYLERVLRRYRPDIDEAVRATLTEKLVRGYPDHGFVIDREELTELGVPHRSPTPDEDRFLRQIADGLEGEAENTRCIEVFQPRLMEDASAADAHTARDAA